MRVHVSGIVMSVCLYVFLCLCVCVSKGNEGGKFGLVLFLCVEGVYVCGGGMKDVGWSWYYFCLYMCV